MSTTLATDPGAVAVVVDADGVVVALSGRGHGLILTTRTGAQLREVAPELDRFRPPSGESTTVRAPDGGTWRVQATPSLRSGTLLMATRLPDDLAEIEASQEDPFEVASSVLARVANGVLITDHEARIVWSNDAVSRITGYEAGELVGQYPSVFGSGRHEGSFFEALWAQLWKTGCWEGEIWNRRKSGEVYPEWLTISAFQWGGEIIGWIGVFSDLSTVRGSDERLLRLAHHDPLTGLPNRLLLNDRIEHALEQARRRQRRVGVLFIDLDNFKPINDSMGHEIGDGVLKAVAARLTERLRAEDTVARLGGDEFIVVIDPLERENHAARMARDVISRLREPIPIAGGVEVQLGASIGVARFPDDAADAQELLRLADTAMYSAKKAGGNTFRFWKPELTRAAEQKLRLEEELREAIEKRTIEVWYQPIFGMSSGGVCGIEAMIRWTHPSIGLLEPPEFLPLAEQTGLILPLGKAVRSMALEDFEILRADGHTGLSLTLNMSGSELASKGAVESILDEARSRNVPLDQLCVDVAEEALLQDFEQTRGQLLTLHQAGVTLQLDDFGAGHLALANLMRIPFRYLKLDRHLVRRIADGEDARRLCSLTTTVARHQDLKVCAVGVETEEQAAFLRDIGIECWQGFLGARPMPLEALRNAGLRPLVVHLEHLQDEEPERRASSDPGRNEER